MECKEQDAGNNKDNTGPADTLQVPAAVMPNFNMEIAANVLVDKTGTVVQMDVPEVHAERQRGVSVCAGCTCSGDARLQE